MGAAWYQAKAGLRARRRGVIALMLVIGLAAGVVITAVAGARRADTALARWMRTSNASDVELFHPNLRAADVARLPMVESVGESVYAGINFPTLPLDEREHLVPIAAGDSEQFHSIDRPHVLAGRLSVPTRRLEIMVSEALGERRRLPVGAVLRGQPITPAELAEAQSGDHAGPYAGPFSGPLLDLRVVGIVRAPADLAVSTDEADSGFIAGTERLYLTPAFHRAYTREQFGFTGLHVRLHDGEAAVPEFLRQAELLAGEPIEGAAATAPTIRKTQRAIQIEALALYVFSILAGVAIVMIFGQMLIRDVLLARENVDVLRAMGMTRLGRVMPGLVRAAVILAGATVVAIAFGAALSSRFPVGLGRLAEARPGFDFHAPILGVGAVVLTSLLLAVVTIGTWRVPSQAAAGVRSPWLPRVLSRIGAPLAVVNGARLAVTRGRGALALPLASTIAGLVIAIVGLTSSAVFAASLERLVGTPRLQGWAWDAYVRADDDATFAAVRNLASDVADDPAVSELAITNVMVPVRVGRFDAAATGIDAVEGQVFPPLSSGRMAIAKDEVVIPPQLARRWAGRRRPRSC